MKTCLFLFLSLMPLLGLAKVNAKINVFACEPEWASLAREVGGDNVDVFSATTALQDPHRIQARPSLIAAYRRADMLICTGAELELGWLPALAQKANNPKLRAGTPNYLEVSQLVEMLEIPASLDRSQGDVHPYGNPHIQTDPRNFTLAARELALRLGKIDPTQAANYAQRQSDFEARWLAAIQRWENMAAPLKNLAVVSAHQGFPYLYKWLGMQRVAILESKPGVSPSARHLKEVLEGLTANPARIVIYAAYQDDRPALWLAEHAHIRAVKLPYTTGGAPGTQDLFGLFDVSVARLLAAAVSDT